MYSIYVIGILDYGIGNPRSIFRMCETSGIDSQIVTSEKQLIASSHLILPGVGSFDSCAIALKTSGMDVSLTHRVRKTGVPLLGICVGAQLLGTSSEEGIEPGLGLMSHKTVRLKPENYPVPHIGWKSVAMLDGQHFHSAFDEDPRFYFSHSYVIKASCDTDRYGTFEYEETLDAILKRDNVVGVQFHPEKSHRFGRRLIEWFGTWAP